MPISAITLQPGTGSLNAAYRPILYQVQATRTDGQPIPPVVYADLYLNGTYYRSQSHNQPTSTSATSSIWLFDIQDLCQQALRSRLGLNGGSQIVAVPESYASVQLRFRSSGYTAAGFIQPEGTEPVQGTGNTPPVPGTGTASNMAFAVLATLQHASSQDLAAHLGYYRSGTWQDALPLTHRPVGKVGLADSDYYPIFYTGNGYLSRLRLLYRNGPASPYMVFEADVATNGFTPGGTGQTNDYNVQYTTVDNGNGTKTLTVTFNNPGPTAAAVSIDYYTGSMWNNDTGSTSSPRNRVVPSSATNYRFVITFNNGQPSYTYYFPATAFQPGSAKGAYLLPFGTANLAAIFPDVVWLSEYDYYIQALDNSGNVVATSTANRLSRCADSDKVRLHFLSYLGQYDALQFLRPNIDHDDDGETYTTGLSAMFTKPEGVLHRWNVRANDTYELTLKCREAELQWVQELADSPNVVMEWRGTEGQSNSYLSMVKQKGTMRKVKQVEDYEYILTMQFVLGNPVVPLRG